MVDPLSNFSFHDWCNKGRGMCYPVCGMVHIKEPLLLIGKSSSCGGSGFPLSLSEWSFTIMFDAFLFPIHSFIHSFMGFRLFLFSVYLFDVFYLMFIYLMFIYLMFIYLFTYHVKDKRICLQE